MKFDVPVEKRLYCTGIYRMMEADTPEEAREKVDTMINKGHLQTTAIDWEDPQYEDMTFETTGDVEPSVKLRVSVGRPLCINGDEFLLTKKGAVKFFPSELEARAFMKSEGLNPDDFNYHKEILS